MLKLRRQPDLEQVFFCMSMMQHCHNVDIAHGQDFDLGAIMGQLDYYCELHYQLYGEEKLMASKNVAVDPNSRQVSGSHYNLNSFQHWDLVAATGWGYFEGQITKYIARWRKKNGLSDIDKAVHYFEKLVTLYERGVYTLVPKYDTAPIAKFVEHNPLDDLEFLIFITLANYTSLTTLLRIREPLNQLREEALRNAGVKS